MEAIPVMVPKAGGRPPALDDVVEEQELSTTDEMINSTEAAPAPILLIPLLRPHAPDRDHHEGSGYWRIRAEEGLREYCLAPK
jgi:hypothetical protein